MSVMPIKQASWTHGVGLQVESHSWTVHRRGPFTTVTPSFESTFGWVHFAIPTPVIIDGVRLKPGFAAVRFSTGTTARITAMHVHDGETMIAAYNGLSLGGQQQVFGETLPDQSPIIWGTAISVAIQFSGTGPNDYVQFIAAGIEFHA